MTTRPAKRRDWSRLRRKGIEAFFQTLTRVGRLHPRAWPHRHGVEVLRNLAYGPSTERWHRLDVYRPTTPADGPRPVVLYAHGGGFSILSKETHWLMGLLFARRGYVVLNLNYRLAPDHPFPAALQDVCLAYRWAVEHATELGGDPQRIAVAGESAGANLVTALTIATCFERPEPWAKAVYELGVVPRACLPFCGILQVSDPGRFTRRKPGFPSGLQDQIRNVSRGYLGEETAEDRGLADPLLRLEEEREPVRPLPPFFLAVGTKDPLLDDTRRASAALERRGVDVETEIEPNAVHAYHAFIWTKKARRCWKRALAFVDQHLAAPAVGQTPIRPDEPVHAT